jgi:hypothetical protein
MNEKGSSFPSSPAMRSSSAKPVYAPVDSAASPAVGKRSVAARNESLRSQQRRRTASVASPPPQGGAGGAAQGASAVKRTPAKKTTTFADIYSPKSATKLQIDSNYQPQLQFQENEMIPFEIGVNDEQNEAVIAEIDAIIQQSLGKMGSGVEY